MFDNHMAMNAQINLKTNVERVAELVKASYYRLKGLGFDSRDQRVGARKSLGQALNSHCLWPPSSNGYLVER